MAAAYVKYAQIVLRNREECLNFGGGGGNKKRFDESVEVAEVKYLRGAPRVSIPHETVVVVGRLLLVGLKVRLRVGLKARSYTLTLSLLRYERRRGRRSNLITLLATAPNDEAFEGESLENTSSPPLLVKGTEESNRSFSVEVHQRRLVRLRPERGKRLDHLAIRMTAGLVHSEDERASHFILELFEENEGMDTERRGNELRAVRVGDHISEQGHGGVLASNGQRVLHRDGQHGHGST